MASNKKKIDINKASSEDLETLVGIGHAKAEAIAEARQAQGGFDSVNALLDIPGIGPVLLEQIRDVIICGKYPQKTPIQRKSDREKKGKRHAVENDLSSLVTPSTSNSSDCHHTRSPASCASKTPCSRSRSVLNADNCRRKLTRSTSKAIAEAASKENAEYSDDSDGDNVISTKMTYHSDCESVNDAESSSIALSQQAGSVSVPSSVESPGVMDCVEECISSSPDNAEMCDTTSDLLDKPWMKRKSDGNGTADTSSGKKPRSLQVNTYDSDYPEYDSAASLRSCLAAACNSGSIRKQRIPSKSNPPPQLSEWLKIYQEWSHAERLLALDELIELCEPTQVRHLMAVIEPQFQRDFISLLPKELALYVLSFLEPRDLLQAAQTCRYWRVLAEDNLLWREKCREESIDEAMVFENRIRRRHETNGNYVAKSPWKNLYLRQKAIEHNWRANPIRPPKVLKGHDDHVITCLEFSGTKIVSGSDDNTLKVWSALTGKCLKTLVGHTGGVWSSQMDGNIIISGSTDRTLKVWNAETGQCTHTLYGHTSTVRCMHLHRDQVVSGSRDATLRLWNVETGQCLHVLMGHMAAVRCVQYDGKRVVSGAYDYTVRVWDPDTETCIHILNGHTNRVYSLQFDGVHIVSGSLDTSIRVWDVESGNCLHTLIGHQSLTSGMELKDNLLVSGNADSTVKVWDITTGQCLQTLQGPNKHQSAVTCLQFNKKFVITSSDDGSVKIWDLKGGDFYVT